MDREPAVAGTFYPRDPRRLAAEVSGLLRSGEPAAPALGILSPHAGYRYSGAVAGETFAQVVVPERVVLIGPNHTGRGEPVALWPDGAFATPLGPVRVDPELTAELADHPVIREDRVAHLREHALEVQLPFLQVRRPGVSIAALCLGPLSLEQVEEVGRALAAALARFPALLVASSDMSHYVSARRASALDHRALERLLALDARGLFETVRSEQMSMCGVVPATAMLFAARALGATQARLVRYAHSGEATGDLESVVGYAGALVS